MTITQATNVLDNVHPKSVVLKVDLSSAEMQVAAG